MHCIFSVYRLTMKHYCFQKYHNVFCMKNIWTSFFLFAFAPAAVLISTPSDFNGCRIVPLVHYTTGDLQDLYLKRGETSKFLALPSSELEIGHVVRIDSSVGSITCPYNT